MGLFSSSYKTTVGTTVSRVIEDASLPQSVKTGVINSIFDKGPVDDYILEELVAGVGIRAGRMYEYGKNQYSYGLPGSTLLSSHDGTEVVAGLLTDLHGFGTTIEYSHFGPLNLLHYGWLTLTQSHGFDPLTNVLGTLSTSLGFTAYLKDLIVVVQEATIAERSSGSLDQWGIPANAGNTTGAGVGIHVNVAILPATPFEVDALASGDSLRAVYVWKDAAGVSHEGSFVIPVTGYDMEADYYQAKYANPTSIGYWLYKLGTGTIPELEAVYAPGYDGLGSFFPWTYFRYGKVSMADNPESVEYKTSKKLVKYLGMDYAAITEAIHENPDIGQVEQAMMMLAVPANTTNPLEQRYLFDFFSKLYLEAGALGVGHGVGPLAPKDLVAFGIKGLLKAVQGKIGMVIQDARFKMTVSCWAIFKKTKAGNIGAINSYASGQNSKTTTEIGTDKETGLPYEVTYTTPFHYYRKQVTTTLYEEVQVYGMRMTYHIYGEYTATGVGTQPILMIPLDASITDAYSLPDKELLYARSLHYIFNSRVVTKVKWYQRGLFKIVVQVIGIAIAIYNLPAGMAVMAASMTAQQLIVFIAMKLLEYVLVSIAIKLFIKLVGAKLAFLVSIVAAIRGVYIALEAGSIAGAPWAKELLQLASNLSSAVGDSYTQAIRGLQKEAEDFGQYIEDKTKELNDVNALLNTRSVLSPFVIFGESPDEFFDRTVHSGNIGIRGIEAVSNFVEMSLTLPKLTDSLQGNNYGFV